MLRAYLEKTHPKIKIEEVTAKIWAIEIEIQQKL
jgi:hypothetical protein